LAIVLGLVSAVLFAVGNVVEQRVASRAPDAEQLRPRLLIRLLRNARWRAGFLSDVGGYGAQAAALGFGALLLVAPLVAFGLLFSLLIEARLDRQRLTAGELTSAIMLCSGVGVFLGVGDPSGGRAVVPASRWAPVAIVVGGAVVLCVIARRWPRGARKATIFGCASGITFGVNAAVTKTVVHVIGDRGVLHVFARWELYALAVLSIGGFLIIQSAFQAGSLKAALPAMEVMEPIVATIIGVVILEEHLDADTLGDRTLIGAAIAAMLLGTVVLARSESARDSAKR
jgi:drug/metabolite transporter (DMT)-like permease